MTILGIDREASGRDRLGGQDFDRHVARRGRCADLLPRSDLPFIEAVRDPAKHIRWRFGTIDSPEAPPVVLEKMPVCANCHSFSKDGATLGMDVDYANDKGAYIVRPVARDMTLDREQILTWSDYKREDKQPTFGLLSQVSPDGRYVVSTVKDRSVFSAQARSGVQPTVLPDPGDPGRLRSPGEDDSSRCRAPTTRSSCRAIPRGVRTASTLSLPEPRLFILANLSDNRKLLLSEEECPEFLKEGGNVPVRPVPHPVQRRPGRPGGAAGRGLAQRHEQLLRQVFARRQVDRLLPGQELHAAAAGQRAVHHSGGRRRGPATAVQHGTDEFLAQLVAQQPLAGVLLEGQLALHATVPDSHRRRPATAPRRAPAAVHRRRQGREHPGIRQRTGPMPSSTCGTVSERAIVRRHRRTQRFLRGLRLGDRGLSESPGDQSASCRRPTRVGASRWSPRTNSTRQKTAAKSLELEPNRKYAHFHLAKVQAKLGRPAEAITTLSRVPPHGPARCPNARVPGRAAGGYRQPRRRRSSIWRKQRRLDPRIPLPQVLLGILLVRDGRTEAADSCFRNALQATPLASTRCCNCPGSRPTATQPELRDRPGGDQAGRQGLRTDPASGSRRCWSWRSPITRRAAGRKPSRLPRWRSASHATPGTSRSRTQSRSD